MSEFSSLVYALIARWRTKQTIDNIEKNNELKRNITRYEPSEIEGFIERDRQVGSYVISGANANGRAKAAASIAACSLAQGVPTVILHEGNSILQNYVTNATSFSGNKVIIAQNSSVYDPFYNRSAREICNLMANSSGSNMIINAVAQQYVMGVTDFIKSKNIPPYCEMFMSCPYSSIFDKLDESLQRGYLTDQKANSIRTQLMQGQNEMASVQAFFSQLAYQGAGILSNNANRKSAVNIRTAVSHDGLIMIDIGSSTNDILLNLIVNEIKEVLSSGKKLMLVLDGISINANDLLAKLMKSLSARCLSAIVAEDVHSMLGSDDNLFYSFVGNACKCIVFRHIGGISCNKWAEVFGYYDADKISQNIGSNQNFQWGYGFGSQYTINVSSNREHIVKPEEISRMAVNEAYILDRNASELAFTTII